MYAVELDEALLGELGSLADRRVGLSPYHYALVFRRQRTGALSRRSRPAGSLRAVRF